MAQKITDPESRKKTIRRAEDNLSDLLAALGDRIDELEQQRNSLITEMASKPVVRPETSTPISCKAMKEMGFALLSKHASEWTWSRGRLQLWVRDDGTWGLRFDSMYGGQIGSYRKLKSMEEVALLLELLGMKQ